MRAHFVLSIAMMQAACGEKSRDEAPRAEPAAPTDLEGTWIDDGRDLRPGRYDDGSSMILRFRGDRYQYVERRGDGSHSSYETGVFARLPEDGVRFTPDAACMSEIRRVQRVDRFDEPDRAERAFEHARVRGDTLGVRSWPGGLSFFRTDEVVADRACELPAILQGLQGSWREEFNGVTTTLLIDQARFELTMKSTDATRVERGSLWIKDDLVLLNESEWSGDEPARPMSIALENEELVLKHGSYDLPNQSRLRIVISP